MALFWHNHFTTQLRVIGSPQLMLRQHLLFRAQALGNYADLLRSVITDPAMLAYLNGRNNRKGRPNENLARELLELFTLGEGHYTEADIKAAARALSGWTLDPVSGTARFAIQRHDDGEKRFLGHARHWGLDGIVAILLQTPRTAEWLVEKLWRELISPEPDPVEVKRLAALFHDAGYEVRPLLRALILSDAFWAPANRGTLIKSPIELIVGTLRRLDIPAPPGPQLVALGRQMGQDLFDPPDVKGWRGQNAWIDANSLLARERFVNRISRDLADESAQAGSAWAELDAATLTRLLWPVDTGPAHLGGGPSLSDAEQGPPATTEAAGVREALIAALLDPRYQLK
jgi:uncharacterized protein (DUF1800 family)